MVLRNTRICRLETSKNGQAIMATSMMRHKDCLSMTELARRFMDAALNVAPNCVGALKRRVMLVKPKAPFQRFVQTKKFSQLLKILKNDRCNFHSWLPIVTEGGNGESALHLLLKYNPPVEVVDWLLQRMRQIQPEGNPVVYQDQFGMTPLHVAVARSCNVRIIELLLFGNGVSADVKNVAGIADCHDRYPLHYICAIPSRIQNQVSEKKSISISNDTLRIIRCLVVSFPAAIDSPDKNGWTAIQMAQSLNAHEKVLEFLQNSPKGICQSNKEVGVVLDSSVLTPTTCATTNTELGLPFDEIHIPNNNDTDYEDDVSTIGWNLNIPPIKLSLTKQSISTKREALKNQIDLLDRSIHDVNVSIRQFKRDASQKFRFI